MCASADFAALHAFADMCVEKVDLLCCIYTGSKLVHLCRLQQVPAYIHACVVSAGHMVFGCLLDARGLLCETISLCSHAVGWHLQTGRFVCGIFLQLVCADVFQ